MNENDWRRAAPLPEEYSRVTNPQRFRPLHARALALVERLAAEFEVVRSEAFVLMPSMTPFAHALPPVTLTAAAAGAAPIAFAFTGFPSVILRCGRSFADSFPSCGCDACRETAEDEGDRLEWMVAAVVAGGFVEELVIPWFGRANVRWWLSHSSDAGLSRRSGGTSLPRARARALAGAGPRRMQWQPWSRRVDASGLAHT